MQQVFTNIYKTLQENPSLQAMITDVYQFPAEDLEYPYVLLELLEADSDNGLPPGQKQQAFTLEVHIVSTYKGIKEVNAIADLVKRMLETTLRCPEGNITLKLLSRTIRGQQDTKTQRLRIGTLQFAGVWRF